MVDEEARRYLAIVVDSSKYLKREGKKWEGSCGGSCS